jgi:hypothetical protein
MCACLATGNVRKQHVLSNGKCERATGLLAALSYYLLTDSNSLFPLLYMLQIMNVVSMKKGGRR